MVNQLFSKLNGKETIWRYLDLTKFIALLENKALYFTRVDKLGDPFEGATSKANVKLRPEVYKEVIESSPEIFELIPRSNEAFRKNVLVNCWHMDDFESLAMWKIYLKTNEGIAIKATVERLSESFSPDLQNKIYIETVKYIDYEKDWLPEGNMFYPIIHKRKSFSFENEVRAIYQEFNTQESEKEGESRKILLEKPIYEHGKNIEVDINKLVGDIFVAPTCSKWFKDLLQSLITKYGIMKNVIQSSLDDDPVY